MSGSSLDHHFCFNIDIRNPSECDHPNSLIMKAVCQGLHCSSLQDGRSSKISQNLHHLVNHSLPYLRSHYHQHPHPLAFEFPGQLPLKPLQRLQGSLTMVLANFPSNQNPQRQLLLKPLQRSKLLTSSLRTGPCNQRLNLD